MGKDRTVSLPDPVRLVHITTVPESLEFMAGQVGYMKARGIEVHAVSSPGSLLDRFAVREEIAVHAVTMQRRMTPLNDLVAVFRIWQVLRQIRPTIVHAHTPKGGLLGTVAAWLARVPVRIYHIRGLPFMTATGRRRQLLRWTEKVSCFLAHRVFCVSHSIREVAIGEALVPPEKSTVFLGGSGNGVDATNRFNPEQLGPEGRNDVRSRLGIPPEAVVLGYVGRIVRDKGVTELVEAWKCLRDERPDLHLLVVGPFESQDPVPPGVEATLQSDPRIHLVGFTRDIPALYSSMDLVVLPSYREGFPNVLLEAAAMKLPVVSTRVPGCTDAVDEEVTGTLVEVRNGRALAAAIESYLTDPALRRRHGEAGRVRVLSQFRREAIWEAVHQEYLSLLRGKGPALGDQSGRLFVNEKG